MPAFNVAPFVRQAIDTVLGQEEVDLELIVVDDGSTDDTAALVASVHEPRIRLLRNGRRRGIAYCHNVVLRESRAPFIAHVDADDFLRPGALRKMVQALEDDPAAGQAHCYFFDVDENGRTTSWALRERWMEFRGTRRPPLDYKARLARTSGVMNALRTYRRAVLEELGGFDETLPFGEDYDMALRLIDRHGITLVPEFLYCRRVHRHNTVEALRFRVVRSWLLQYRIRRRLVRTQRVHFLRSAGLDPNQLVRELLLPGIRRARRRGRDRLERVLRILKWRLQARLSAALRRFAVKHLAWWPIGFARLPRRRFSNGKRRVAYYLRSFPVLSETFIQRELTALMRSGIAVRVIAHHPLDDEHLDEDGQALMKQTRYLASEESVLLTRYRRRFLRQCPFTLLNLFLYVRFRRLTVRKAPHLDREIFRRAICLAGVLQDDAVTQVHSPWAGPEALVALLAARILSIPYTVQARASDIHRHTSAYGLREKLEHAAVVITNTRYNERIIRDLLGAAGDGKVRQIYNGVDLTQFRPRNAGRQTDARVTILTVARLIEAKGLEYLLHACRVLKDGGHAVRCDIIGGRAAPDMNYYIELQKLRRRLSLERDVTFHGAQPFDRVLASYAAADLFVLPSVIAKDGSGDVTPNVVIEAMAMELPVVSTRQRGIPELVEDEVTGILVPPRDTHALARAIARLADDEALRREFGKNARKRVEERFDIGKNIRDYVALFGPAVS